VPVRPAFARFFVLALVVTAVGCREHRKPDRDNECRYRHDGATPLPYAYLPDKWTTDNRWQYLKSRGCRLASDGVFNDNLVCCPDPSY
jgi:hypothetical protein